MIITTTGDILRDESEAIVNTVNCVGVMGRGIALQFRNAFPDNYRAYKRACDHQEVVPGKMFVTTTGNLAPPYFVVNFPTKRHWRGKSSLEDVAVGLDDLARMLREKSIHSVAIPPLGCGLGGLDWGTVKALIIERLRGLDDVRITLYEPSGGPAAHAMVRSAESPKMTPGRGALVSLMRQYLDGLLDPAISLLEVHKLMYFMQEAGEPLRLHYEKGPYGPFARNLGHVLKAIEGHFVVGYADGGDAPGKQLALVSGAVEEARRVLAAHHDTHQRFERVAKLTTGFESPYGLELLATVHWIASKEAPASPAELIEAVHAWSYRKRQFTPRQVALAADTLRTQGWIYAR